MAAAQIVPALDEVDLARIFDMDHVRFPLVLLSGPRDA